MKTKFIRNTVMAAASLLFLSACVTATPYQPSKGGINSFGYQDTRIETGKYRVGFRGNSSTDRATVENYILLRAAELSLADGFGHFIILDEGEGSTSNFSSTGFNNGFGGGFGGFGRRGFGFGGGFGGTTTSRTRERRTFDINVVIQAFPGEKSSENYEAFNAQDVITNLRP
jgi:hypothetical protein